MPSRDSNQFNRAVARAVLRLLDAWAEEQPEFTIRGNDPNYEEIAEEYYKHVKLSGDNYEGMRKRLPGIKFNLCSMGERVCLLSDYYYDKCRHIPLEELDEDDISKCILHKDEHGRWIKSMGIWRSTDDDDPIYQTALVAGSANGAHKVRANLARTVDSMNHGGISETDTGHLMKDTMRKATRNVRDTKVEVTKLPRRPSKLLK